MSVLFPSGSARAAEGADVCASGGLAEARVSTSVAFRHDDYAYTKIETDLTVSVPASWKLAKGLLLGRESRAYVNAMTCLTGQSQMWSDLRPSPPAVTTKGDRVKVTYKASSWVNWYLPSTDVGVWQVRGQADIWTVTLNPPPALERSRWDKVTADPGPRGFDTAKPPPSAKAEASKLVWRQKKATHSAPSVAVSLRPSWGTGCATAGLAAARVGTNVAFRHDDQTYTKIETDLTVEVPAGWKHANALLLSRESRAHVNAMACLTRQSQGQQTPRWSELRPNPPVITTKGDRVKVVYKAHSWVNRYQTDIDVGIWQVWAEADVWTVTLKPPPALEGSHWDRITVDPGPPGVETAEPPPTAKEEATKLVWRQMKASAPLAAPAVTVSLKPSWPRLWAAQNNRLTAAVLDALGGLLWTLTISGLLLRAAVLYRQRPSIPAAREKLALRNLELWAVTVVALYLLVRVDDLMRQYVEEHSDYWIDDALLRGHVFALAAAALLCSFAKPPRSIWVAGALLMLPPLVTMTLPETFGLCGSCEGPWTASRLALAMQATASCSLLALTILGFVAVAWRLSVDAELLPKSRRRTPSGQPRDRKLKLRIAGPAVVAWTLLVALCAALTEERNWQRATWLSDRWTDKYGEKHLTDFIWESVWSASYGQQWILSYAWMLTSVAILAVLRTWRASTQAPLDDRADRLLFLTFFPTAVAVGDFRLDNGLVEVLWIPVYMLALYAAVVPLRGRAVLEQPFDGPERSLAEGLGAGARANLMKRARTYREIHAELRRLDQGLTGDKTPERAKLERTLDRLHNWPTSGPPTGTNPLPESVSVVDAALALGPKDNWWENGVRGARFAMVPGLPAAVLGAWSGSVRGEAWQDTFTDLLGLPGTVLQILYWMSTWVGAGFVLGALWRILPGRRGATKALPVAFAFALPLALDALFGWFTQEGATNLALYASTMLLVLTVTGISLDLDTFHAERRFWQSRLGLLLSVYQMRYYSLQVAYLIGQVIAVISIWKFFAEPSATPPDGDK
ncbi:DUF6185 family protein [Streptomyces sp. NPDC046832]|uniref:DUF6185 family protein n=1 Tax=Streptomyces sp. NPDC046832 TaxID=3155020 RepID=UPI0033F08920